MADRFDFWGEGGKSAHSFVAVCVHTFYVSLAFSQCIHRSNYPIRMEWRIDSYSGKKLKCLQCIPWLLHPTPIPCPLSLDCVLLCWCCRSPYIQREPESTLIKHCIWHVSNGNSHKPKGLGSVSRETPAFGTQTAGCQVNLKTPLLRLLRKMSNHCLDIKGVTTQRQGP